MFCIYTDGAGFQLWFETIEEAKRHALYLIRVAQDFDRLYVGDEYDCWGSVDSDGYHVHEDIF